MTREELEEIVSNGIGSLYDEESPELAMTVVNKNYFVTRVELYGKMYTIVDCTKKLDLSNERDYINHSADLVEEWIKYENIYPREYRC